LYTLFQVVQNFKIDVQPGVEFNPVLRTLLTPGDQVPVRFVERQSTNADDLAASTLP
jgi:hypothetical protein